MKYSYIIAIAAAAAAFTACNKADKYASNSIAFNRVEMTRSYRLAGSAADYETERDLTFGCEADILMPTVVYGKAVGAIQDSILSAAFGSSGPDHSAIMTDAMQRIAGEIGYEVTDTVLPDSVVARTANFVSRYDGFFAVEGCVETLTPRILSYAVTTSTYLPHAAHGMYGTRYLNYDLETGKLIELADLFTPEGLAALPAKLRDTARQMEPVIGLTDINALPADDNFYLAASGEIVFAYQPYEVASYAQGEIQIPLEPYMLVTYLTKDGNRLLLNQ